MSYNICTCGLKFLKFWGRVDKLAKGWEPIGSFLVQAPSVFRLGLVAQPRYEAPGDPLPKN